MPKTVLIVDDEKSIVEILKYNLEKADYGTICAYEGKEALQLARSGNPDLILLDVMLPNIDGFEVCRTLRRENNNVPIIMITAREDETDKVFGLELGADDYITKPFSMREVIARVRTNIRRFATQEEPPSPESVNVLRARDLIIDLDRHEVFRNGKSVELSQREYELIKYFASNPGKAVSRQELLEAVWQYEYFGDLRTVDVAVRRLREKLEENPAEPEYVMTKRGFGYFFNGDR